MPAFQLRVNYLSSGAFPFGQVIDHWVFTYVSGPTSLPVVTIPATYQYLQYATSAPGSYVVSAQAFDASNAAVGSPINVAFVVLDPIGSAPQPLPTKVYCTASTGSTNFTLVFLTQSLGQFNGVRLHHTNVILTGPTNVTQVLAAGQLSMVFTGMAIGLYSYTLQSQDVSNNNLGPPMTGQFFYYDDTQTTPAKLQPVTPGITIDTTYSGAQPGL